MLWAFLLSLTTAVSPAYASLAEAPFWKAKEKYYRRIQEERAVIVSVKTENRSEGRHELIALGGGQTVAPLAFVFQEALKPENLKSAIDDIQDVHWEGELLYIRGKAFGYTAETWMRVHSVPNQSIHIEIVRGTLAGAVVDFLLYEVKSPKGETRTEIALNAGYGYVNFPLPKLFAEFGFEVMLQRMAIQMRSFLENRYSEEQYKILPKAHEKEKSG